WGILLARTDPTAPKHRGISYFLLDMRASGITVRPLRQATGSTEFSEVFLDRVRVEPEQLVGAVNQGWDIAMTTLAHERGTGFAFKEQVLQRIALEDAIALARTRRRAADPVVRQEIARRWIDVEIMRLFNWRTLTRLERGEEPGPESSLVKLFWAELTQRLHELALALEGPHAQLAEGRWQQAWLWSRVASIAGGAHAVRTGRRQRGRRDSRRVARAAPRILAPPHGRRGGQRRARRPPASRAARHALSGSARLRARYPGLDQLDQLAVRIRHEACRRAGRLDANQRVVEDVRAGGAQRRERGGEIADAEREVRETELVYRAPARCRPGRAREPEQLERHPVALEIHGAELHTTEPEQPVRRLPLDVELVAHAEAEQVAVEAERPVEVRHA